MVTLEVKQDGKIYVRDGDKSIECADQEQAKHLIIDFRGHSLRADFLLALYLNNGVHSIPNVEWEEKEHGDCGHPCEDYSDICQYSGCAWEHRKVAVLKESPKGEAFKDFTPEMCERLTQHWKGDSISYNEYLEAVGADENNTYARKIYERLIHNGYNITRKK